MFPMSQKKEQELQQNIEYFRGKLPTEEPELPYALQAEVLKQKLLTEEKTKTAISYPWKKLLPMACALVMVAVLGVSPLMMSGNRTAVADNNAEPQVVSYALEQRTAEAPLDADTEEVSTLGGRYTVMTLWKTWEDCRDSYPSIDEDRVYIISENGASVTIIDCLPDNGGERSAIAVLGGDCDVSFTDEKVTVTEIESGSQLHFTALTLEPLE